MDEITFDLCMTKDGKFYFDNIHDPNGDYKADEVYKFPCVEIAVVEAEEEEHE